MNDDTSLPKCRHRPRRLHVVPEDGSPFAGMRAVVCDRCALAANLIRFPEESP